MELKNQPKPNSPKVGEPQPFHTDASGNHLGMVLKPMENNGRPQLPASAGDRRISEPSTVVRSGKLTCSHPKVTESFDSDVS